MRLGDRVSRGQTLAKVEDREILEQVKQAQASFEVAAATIRQREADLKLAQTNLDRSRSLFERQLIPKQTYDDTDARYQAAAAQLDLAKAQYSQAQARLDELKINLANTTITSPVSGFVGKRVARSRRVGHAQLRRSSRSSTSASSGWWRTSSRRTCGASPPG